MTDTDPVPQGAVIETAEHRPDPSVILHNYSTMKDLQGSAQNRGLEDGPPAEWAQQAKVMVDILAIGIREDIKDLPTEEILSNNLVPVRQECGEIVGKLINDLLERVGTLEKSGQKEQASMTRDYIGYLKSL